MVGKRERETKIAIENGETQKKATTELTLQSTSHAAVFFQLFLPMIIRLRHIYAAMMGNRVVMVFLV